METRPFLVNGDWRTGDDTFDVTSPYDDSVVAYGSCGLRLWDGR